MMWYNQHMNRAIVVAYNNNNKDGDDDMIMCTQY